ncbi:cytochrome P450 705A12-like [Pistacia vera]|uniref:cytochrome P450 705A12-like n=1 Tax=Pistacia vera TaxID=55513 RepID=UPI001263D22E|nr:cytochrome P450 705A12-like [Pistacia vera]
MTTAINVCAIMRDPDLWEKPNEFQPERFLDCPKEQDNNQDGETKKQLLNFLSFEGGRRSCPGSLLSFALMNTAIAVRVQCFDFEVDGHDAKLKLESGTGMSLSLPQQLLCRPVVHFNPFA